MAHSDNPPMTELLQDDLLDEAENNTGEVYRSLEKEGVELSHDQVKKNTEETKKALRKRDNGRQVL